jgi:rhamnose transport system ATP-binding protein
LFLDLSLAENVFIGRQPKKGKIIDWKFAQSEAARLFKELGVELDPKRQARGLSIADQQVVEIAKALSMNANIILMDEPTAALSASEVERLMTVMKSLKAANKAVIFVSHRLDEVFAISDYITVMRDGATVSEASVGDTNLQKVIKDMVGRELTELFPKTENKIGAVVLEVTDLTNPAYFRNISFNVKKGEIVALAGLVGAGRSEVARAIFGVDKYESGSVKINGEVLPAGSPVAAMERKIALVPEDRRQQGLFMIAGVNRNISMESFGKLTDRGLLNFKRERELTNTWREKLSIKFNNQADPVDRLSGGNQQKTVLAKWLATDPDILIVDEPTRGIDVATKAEVHRLVNQAASEGKAVLMISSELPEVLGMADRIIVMREGRQVAEYSRKEATQEKIIAAATTGKKSA